MKIWRIALSITIILLLVAIFILSAQPADKSNALSKSVTENILKDPTEQAVKDWNETVRKTAHFSLYLLLGMSVAGLCLCYPLAGWKRWLITLVFCLCYAVSDEIHQIFVPGRGCEFTDVVIDFAGSLCGCILVIGGAWLSGRRAKEEK